MTERSDEPAPLSFKILVTAAGFYLVIRLVQGVVWFVEWVR
jgi:hypothetical protein